MTLKTAQISSRHRASAQLCWISGERSLLSDFRSRQSGNHPATSEYGREFPSVQNHIMKELR